MVKKTMLANICLKTYVCEAFELYAKENLEEAFNNALALVISFQLVGT